LDPNTVVLSEGIAKKNFGIWPALNKVLHMCSSTNGDQDLLVAGVFRPVNTSSHIDGRQVLPPGISVGSVSACR
jgi:putative ABC transport system permease protein